MTHLDMHLSLAGARTHTLDYLAERWEVENPAPQDVIETAIVRALEILIEETIADWSWCLRERTGRQIEATVRNLLDRQRTPPVYAPNQSQKGAAK